MSPLYRALAAQKARLVMQGKNQAVNFKLNIYLTDLAHFALVNTVMAEYFTQPYPARAAVGVAQLPRNALVEADGVLEIGA